MDGLEWVTRTSALPVGSELIAVESSPLQDKRHRTPREHPAK